MEGNVLFQTRKRAGMKKEMITIRVFRILFLPIAVFYLFGCNSNPKQESGSTNLLPDSINRLLKKRDGDTVVFTSKYVLNDGEPITNVIHDTNNEWQFLSDHPVEIVDIKLVTLKQILKHDSSVKTILKLGLGCKACRKVVNSKWSISCEPNKPEGKAIAIDLVHLHDTVRISGNFILFLRPDEARFNSSLGSDSSQLYTSDGDFGYGIQGTMDNLPKAKNFRDIKAEVSAQRYILINDCKKCPVLIDRDTIDYGYILSGRGKEIKLYTGSIHSGDYLGEVAEYFNIKR
jgi:hypothetical protein